jgi:histidyl-tRNA synthetase
MTIGAPSRAASKVAVIPAVREALRDAPRIGESLCAECEAHFTEVRRLLEAYGVAYTLEPTLVRGLDYYTRTVFEFVGPEEKAQSAICSGGRYDRLIEGIGGQPTPGIGFGAGIERAVLALEQEGVTAAAEPLDVFFVVDGGSREQLLVAMAQLRRRGLSADTDYAGRSLVLDGEVHRGCQGVPLQLGEASYDRVQ